jgi:nitrite reductase (NADH) large subunit
MRLTDSAVFDRPGKQRLVVIGNGMVGARFVEELVAKGGNDRFEIVVFGDEPVGNYNRILLSGVLAGTHEAHDTFINPIEWYAANGVTLHVGVRVTAIDRVAKLVRGDGHLHEPYDILVIATGSSAFVPPFKGMGGPGTDVKEGLFTFRTLDDCERILSYVPKARTAAVIGGGLLGLEAARGLLERGVAVHVVHLRSHLMEMQLDSPAGLVLKETLEGMGVTVHLDKQTSEVLGTDHVEGVAFADGSTLPCDMVIVSAGIRPNVSLAAAAGLAVERGIVVTDELRCPGDSSVFAIGECAEHRGQLYGLVAPLWEQAKALAGRLSGRIPDATYTGSRVSTKLKVLGVDLAVMGDQAPASASDEVVTYSEPTRGIYKKLIVRNGRLGGAILLGDASAAPMLLQAFDRGSELPDNRAELLFQLSAAETATGIADLSDAAQICNCNGVSKGALVTAVEAGHCTLKSLCEATRAGMGCGACKPQVQLVLESAAGDLVQDDPSVHFYVPGIPLRKADLVRAIRERRLTSVSAVFAQLAGGREDPASKTGLAALLRIIWGAHYDDERDARFINDRVHANVQKDGTFTVVPRIFGGVTTATELRRIADVAERYAVPMVKITGGQRIDLVGVAKDKLPDVWRDLGMPSGHAYAKSFRTCKTCIGSEFCRYGVGDSTALGVQIERRYQGIETPHKLKLATAGCPRNCSEATTKDIGAVAIDGGKWEIYVGGAAGTRVRKGDLLVVVSSHEDVLLYMGRFMQYYREHAKYLERTFGFVERIGIESLRRILVDDSEHICAQLDADISAAVDAYVDPWQEAADPVHPSQFADLLEPVGAVGGPSWVASA